jgi:hypothetical protein
MTKDEAYEIVKKMGGMDHRNPTPEQREAKNLIYDQVIAPKYDGDPPPHLEPDYMEGWKSV